MDKFEIVGGRQLNGTVQASGSKNAALPILFASILAGGRTRLSRVPQLRDIDTTLALLKGIGAEVKQENSLVEISIPSLSSTEASYDLVRTMRASILMLGPMLARAGKAKVSLPGGCAIGTRPVDIHLQALEKMGAELRLESGYVVGQCPGGLKGAEITFRFPSVGATEHLMMAASLAKGRTLILNAAREPEIVNLGDYLRALGADVAGDGSDTIEINGVDELKGADFEVMFDRIEAATLMLAGPITGGKVRVEKIKPDCLEAFFSVLQATGAEISLGKDWAVVSGGANPKPANFATEPHPGFPTDLQAQMMAHLAQIEGKSEISETIFENRFMHVPELNRMGAEILTNGAKAAVNGRRGCYQGATVMATDLRASASLVLAGLAAKGSTSVRRIYHLDRGYEHLETKLASLGAKIDRLEE